MPNRLSQETSPNIKVDHQDRPDLDDIYQKFVQMKGQGGGWSVTVFVTPQVRVINLVRQKSHNMEYS